MDFQFCITYDFEIAYQFVKSSEGNVWQSEFDWLSIRWTTWETSAQDWLDELNQLQHFLKLSETVLLDLLEQKKYAHVLEHLNKYFDVHINGSTEKVTIDRLKVATSKIKTQSSLSIQEPTAFAATLEITAGSTNPLEWSETESSQIGWTSIILVSSVL